MAYTILYCLYVVELKALAREAGAESISQNGNTTVIQLREPVGGARVALQKALGRTTQVGHSQIRVTLNGTWKQELVQTLEGLATFKAQVLELAGTG
jgi:hypothetical protein